MRFFTLYNPKTLYLESMDTIEEFITRCKELHQPLSDIDETYIRSLDFNRNGDYKINNSYRLLIYNI